MNAQNELAELRLEAEEMDAIEKRFAAFEAELATVKASDADRARENAQLKTENAQLKASNVSLAAKVAALEERGGRKVIPRPPVESQTRVSYPAQPSAFTMPSSEELSRQREIVGRVYPDLLDYFGAAFYGSKDERECDWDTQFKAAFRAIGAMKRLDGPDRKHYLSHHIDAAEARLRTIGVSATLRFGPFVAALIAWGDVAYSGLGLQHDGTVVEAGLSEYIGRAASDASWRRVLDTGAILPMGAPARRMAAPSRVQIRAGDPGVW